MRLKIPSCLLSAVFPELYMSAVLCLYSPAVGILNLCLKYENNLIKYFTVLTHKADVAMMPIEGPASRSTPSPFL